VLAFFVGALLADLQFRRVIWDNRALIAHYGSEKVDLEFLEVSEGGIASTTLGLEVRPWFVDLGDINGTGIGLGNKFSKVLHIVTQYRKFTEGLTFGDLF
jgi:hypothetical protein